MKRGIEDVALAQVALSTELVWARTGFRKCLRQMMAGVLEELGETLYRDGDFKYLPDAHRHDDGTLHVLEVEDTHPMPREKLLAYTWLWVELDATADFDIALWVCDRYGHTLRQVNLALVYHATLET